MSSLMQFAGAILLFSGSAVVAVAGIGVFRLADPFMRMHAATKAGVVGAGLVLLGSGLVHGTVGAILTSILAVAFLFLTSPIASHVMGRAAYISGAPLSPATMSDALAGVLPRRVTDIAPGRTVRRKRAANPVPPDHRHPHFPQSKESAMSVIPLRDQDAHSDFAAADAANRRHPIRRLTLCLVGGPMQPSASRFALDIARMTSCDVTALTMVEAPGTLQRQAVPLGGNYWSGWLADQQRLRSRAAAASALAEFGAMADEARLSTTQRHEEGHFPALVKLAAGCDLLVVPGGVDRTGMPCAAVDEVAATVSGLGLAPVLRVTRRPLQVRRVGVLVDDNPDSGRLAQALVRTGLWRDAAVSMVAIGDHRKGVRDVVDEQTELLRAHGFDVGPAQALRLSCETEDVDAITQPLDVIVARQIGRRRPSGWFDALRTDVYATAARNCPVVMLP